ncbi:MAG: TetR/AcrR family transcriptional regulator [Betaproteobacteria bacterium]|nr:TetR/AcrR family transcriptional regulator [Betaproteobacteria bacterium]
MERTESAVLKFASRSPLLGQFRVAALLTRRGMRISPSGVRAIWKRHGLETVYKRLSALGGRRGGKLTDAQDARLRRAKRSLAALAGKDKANGRREYLQTVAARVFARQGYDGTTLQDVAEAAGILPGSMYHYFDSKDDLFAQLHTEGFRALNAAVERAIDGIDDPWARLQAALTAQIQGVVSANAIDAVASGIMFNRGKARLQERMIAERDAYEARIRAMIDALPLPPDVDRSLLRLALLGAVAWTRVWYKPGKKTPAEIVRTWIASFRRR